MDVKAWELAQKAVDELPPYLQDDDLTAERLFKKNPSMLRTIDDARNLLEALVKAGELEVIEKRSGKGGGRFKVYVEVKKGKP